VPVQRRDVCGHLGRMSFQMNLHIILLLSRDSMPLVPAQKLVAPTYVAHCDHVNSEACCDFPQQHSLSRP
jgi:hypothetical protein